LFGIFDLIFCLITNT